MAQHNIHTIFSARRTAELLDQPLNRICNLCAKLGIPKAGGTFSLDDAQFSQVANHIRAELQREVEQVRAEAAKFEAQVAAARDQIDNAGASTVNQLVQAVRLAHAAPELSGRARVLVAELENQLDGAKMVPQARGDARKRGIAAARALASNGRLARAVQIHTQLQEVL
jgi:RNA 3'-terminal phosphate cyclase